MAEVQQKDSGKGGKVKQKKKTLRVDFTPMVDMNMLLITFFMFCTSLSKPQTMEIAMPPKKEITEKVPPPELDQKRAITVILDAGNTVFYYLGKPDYTDYTSLKKSNFDPNSSDGIRQLLLERNKEIVDKIKDWEVKLKKGEIDQKTFKEESSKIKEEIKDSPMVMIKPTDGSSYVDLINILDEMQICNIARYAIIDTAKEERFIMQNWATKGAWSDAAAKEESKRKR